MDNSRRPKIGIIGVGMVGAQMKRYFEEVKGYEQSRDLFLCDTDVTKGYSDDINNADVIFISVPTPSSQDGSADLSRLEDSFKRISNEKIVVIRSTVPPRTTETFQVRYPQHRVLFNPEFLTARLAWEDFIRPERQIAGFTSSSLEAAHLVLSLLPKAPFMSPWGVNTNDQIRIGATEAEIIKYASNIHYFRKVMWANALERVAKKFSASHNPLMEVNFDNIRLAMAADFRIGDSHLDVSYGGYRGVGGHCLPKDLLAFAAQAREMGLEEIADLLEADWKFNEKLLAEQGLDVKNLKNS